VGENKTVDALLKTFPLSGPTTHKDGFSSLQKEDIYDKDLRSAA
jgi:hypothetical protein